MEYLNLYKVLNKESGKFTSFLTDKELAEVIYANGSTTKGLEIYAVNMPKVTNMLDIKKVLELIEKE